MLQSNIKLTRNNGGPLHILRAFDVLGDQELSPKEALDKFIKLSNADAIIKINHMDQNA